MRLPDLVLVIANLKGGTGKTTSAVFMAHVLHERGERVLMVDADSQGSALRWCELAGGWAFPAVGMPTRTLHQQLPGVADRDRYDLVIVDTPPLDEQRGVVMSALRVASDVLVPLAPTAMEFERLAAVQQVINDAADLRPDNSPPRLQALLTRTVSGAASTTVYRELIAELGIPVTKVNVKRLEAFAQAYGDPITNATATAYSDVVTDLMERVR
jgi:chromosome partitioning protein